MFWNTKNGVDEKSTFQFCLSIFDETKAFMGARPTCALPSRAVWPEPPAVPA